jgi:hypothetical protein
MFDLAIALCKVVKSSVGAKTKAVLLDLVGPGGAMSLTNPDKESAGEVAAAQPEFGSLGMVGRPPPPSKIADRDAYTEAFAFRTGDGLIPIAYRDLRLNNFFPAPKPGTVATVGWAGAFDSNEATLNSGGAAQSSIRTIYVPYAFEGTGANRAPSKAHVITLDGSTGNESVSIVHGDGMAILITQGNVAIKNAAGDAYVQVSPDGVVVNGNTVINGGLAVGPVGAVPLALGPQLTQYLEHLEDAISSALTAIGVGNAASGQVGANAFDASVTNTLSVDRLAIPATRVSGV